MLCLATVVTGTLPVATPATAAPPDTPALDDDGLRPTTRTAELRPLDRPVTLHEGESMTHGAAVTTPEAPQMLVVHGLAAGTELAVRSHDGGGWSPWTALVATDAEAPDGSLGEGAGSAGGAGGADTLAVGPVWLGHGIDRIEVAGPPGSVELETLEVLETPASATSPSSPSTRAAATTGSFIRPRSAWATAGMGWPTGTNGCGAGPSYGRVTGMVIHHTAGTNAYAAADVPALIRGIWYHHVQSRGWCDVAYNFFVDRFGQAWEGRQGGITRPVIGGHTYGFNTYTSGVAQLGSFDGAAAPEAMTRTTERLVGWKLGLHGIDPAGATVYRNSAPDTAPNGVPSGGTITRSSVVGHRDLGATTCPGHSTYAQLPRIRRNARTGAHVYALHQAFLGRAPTPDDAAYWSWRASLVGLGGVADEMAHSDAYAGLVVRIVYHQVLGRAPDAAGLAYWLGQLRGGLSVEDLFVYFHGSWERYRQTGGGAAYVTALYQDLLHRAPDLAGLTYWLGQLGRGVPPAVLADSFIDSIESRRDRVERLYQQLLSRRPDPSGHAYWAAVLLPEDDLALATFLATSPEFYAQRFD